MKKSSIWLSRETPWDEIMRGAVWPLVPIALGLGVAIKMNWPYLGWGMGGYWLIALFLCVGLIMLHKGQVIWRVFILLLFVALGFLRLGQVLENNTTKFMAYRYYGPIEGVVSEISQSSSGALRLTLEDVVLERRQINGKVRISLHGDYPKEAIWVGSLVQTTGLLSAPNGPNEPNGYDFRKKAWLEGIAGVGYTRKPLTAVRPSEQSIYQWIQNWRRSQSKLYVNYLGEKIGGFAAALFVGDRSGLDLEVLDSVRQSSLAHLLAISGMHIGTVTGLLFLVSRRFLSLFPVFGHSPLGVRAGAVCAIIGGLFYLTISGAAFSALRAYMMASIFFMALILRRRALSLRTVALTATLIMIWKPESLYNLGFQMSFAATAALVATYQQVQISHIFRIQIFKWIMALLMTSFIAGFATAPFSAYSFQNIPRYGLLANLAAVPVMTFVVLPAGILAFLLQPIGLEEWPLRVAGMGIEWIIGVSNFVVNLGDPTWVVKSGPPISMILILVAGLYLIIVQKRFWVVVPILAVSIVSWIFEPRPMLLVTSDARFFGLKMGEVRQFSRATGHAFAAENWARSDGSRFDQEGNTFKGAEVIQTDLPNNWRFLFTTTKKGAAMVADQCIANTLIIATKSPVLKGDCVFFNEKTILRMGGFAADIENDELIITPNIQNYKVPWSINKSE